MDNTVFLAAEELKLFKECTQALTRIATALCQRDVCQGDGSLDTSPADTGTVASFREDSVTVPDEHNSTLHTPHSTLTENSTLHTPHSTLSKADLRSFLMTKDKDAVRRLFTEFSATKFSEIPEDRYPEVMERARALPDKEAA